MPDKQILISINPKYVEKIITGEKQWEYRKTIWSRTHTISRIYIYETLPVQRIVAYFIPKRLLSGDLLYLWGRTGAQSGLTEKEFTKYFGKTKLGYAIEISNLKILDLPIDPRTRIRGFNAPQNFMYVTADLEEHPPNKETLTEKITFRVREDTKREFEMFAEEQNTDTSQLLRESLPKIIQMEQLIETKKGLLQEIEYKNTLSIERLNSYLYQIALTSSSLSKYAYINFQHGRRKGVIKEFYDTNESKKAFQHAYLYLKYLAKKGITIHPYIELDLHHHFICQVCGHPIEQRDNVVLHHVTLDKYSKPDYNLYYFPKTQRHLLIPLHNACHPKGLESLAFFLKNRYYKRAEKVKLDIINAYFQSFKEFRVLLKRVTTRILEGL